MVKKESRRMMKRKGKLIKTGRMEELGKEREH